MKFHEMMSVSAIGSQRAFINEDVSSVEDIVVKIWDICGRANAVLGFIPAPPSLLRPVTLQMG